MNILLLICLGGCICGVALGTSHADEPPKDVKEIDEMLLCDYLPSDPLCQPEQQVLTAEKRKSAYMRFGRSDPEMMQKRKSAYMRFGKRAEVPEQQDNGDVEMEKRKSAYMRFGKRKSAYMRFGKRSEVGGDEETDQTEYEPVVDKRKSAYMRFGK
uniref:FMRFamide n=1 Tax=Rhabditophanes sp. KR3021 TaxID=114890 RepID=A0AC35TWA8_9BILA